MDLYRDIFRLQAAGSFKDADLLIARVKDQSLMGHVLAQRYLHASYKADFAELSDWLAHYADHPQADRIARLAGARATTGSGKLVKASYTASSIEELDEHGMEAKTYAPEIERTAAQNSQAKDLIKSVRRSIQIYEPSAAMRALNESQAAVYLDKVEKDRIRAMIASGYLYAGKVDDAERIAAAALNGSRGKAPLAGWVHGLAKWQQGRYAQAAQSFEISAHSPYSSGFMVAASSYWAARAHEKAGHDRRYTASLKMAADYPRTFYGMLALAALGRDADLNWDAPELSGSDEDEILGSAPGQRAEKLLAAGEVTLAEAEIRALYVKGNADRKRALLAYAYDRKLPSLTMKLAHAVGFKGKEVYDAALYPSMPWSPNQGFRIDRALIHAIIRQESRFNASAENKSSGATGLMQLMPTTANHVAKADIFTEREGRNLLKTAEVNLDLGQKYVEELLNNSLVGQDLLSLAIAYNAGPGTLARWKAERPNIDDPLLFIETIPYAETRTYVERVLCNYWIYRMRFDQSNESMMALADSKWPRYAALDKGAVKFADAR
jgi:soluble lytic murein transglycosylase-like protein